MEVGRGDKRKLEVVIGGENEDVSGQILRREERKEFHRGVIKAVRLSFAMRSWNIV